MKGSDPGIVISCEHGGNDIPPEWQHLFRNARRILRSHRGRDEGALELARAIAKKTAAPLIGANISRLLIDLNRSLHHPDLFSEFTRQTGKQTKQAIIENVYQPYRRRVENIIATSIAKGHNTIHLSIHSFTPVLDGQVRQTDIGLLYDPGRRSEKIFARQLRQAIRAKSLDWRVRFNYPYRGTADGLTRYLRTRFRQFQYCGIEIEINQAILAEQQRWRSLKRIMTQAIHDVTLPDS